MPKIVNTFYPETAVLTTIQVAEGLGTSVDSVERMDLPFFYIGGGQKERRYIWGQVLEELRRRAEAMRAA